MSRNPSNQYEYWESLKKSFPKEYVEKARERYEKNKEPDLWDKLDNDIRESLKDDAEITVSGEKTDTGLTENFVMGDSHMDIDISVKCPDEILEFLIEFYFDDDEGRVYEAVKMYYTVGDGHSYESALIGISRVVDYFRERIKSNKDHMLTRSLDNALNELRNEVDSHTWFDACDLVACNAVTSVRDGYLHERWNSIGLRLFSSDNGRFVILMTFLDNGPNPYVSFDMYETGVHLFKDDSTWSTCFSHKMLSFIDDEGFSFTSKVLLTINNFINSSENEKS